MKKFVLLTALCLIAGISFGQGLENVVLEDVGPGLVDWSKGVVYAEGCGAPRPGHRGAQARIMAKRAARADSYRNLLETVKGVHVTSETTVENFMTISDVILSKVSGIVKGAQQIGKIKYLPDGTICITLAMRLHGDLTQTLIDEGDSLFQKEIKRVPKIKFNYSPKIKEPKRPPPPKPPRKLPPPPKKHKNTPPGQLRKPPPPIKKPPKKIPPPFKENFNPGKKKWDGLIIDARNSGLKPALMPKIYNQSGAIIYSKNNISDPKTIKSGIVGYAKELEAAKRHFRVAKNPLAIKALKAKGENQCDPVISDKAAKYIQTTEPYSSYLRQGRVMFLFN